MSKNLESLLRPTLNVVFVLAVFYGWVMNLYAIWHTVDNPIAGKFILRCIGIFVPPIGAILGYL